MGISGMAAGNERFETLLAREAAGRGPYGRLDEGSRLAVARQLGPEDVREVIAAIDVMSAERDALPQ